MTIVDPGVVGPGAVRRAWQWTPSVLVPLVICSAWYAIGVRALWRSAGHGHGVSRWQAASFAGGVLTLVAALLSPIDALAET
jgi:putative membrane protein